MELAEMILEYLKVFFSSPVMVAVVTITFLVLFREDMKALLLRVAKIRLPGGTEVSTPQSTRLASAEARANTPLEPSTPPPVEGLPQDLDPRQKEVIENLMRYHIANAYLWEYRYLNYFLVRYTQEVLDWLISLSQPTTLRHYDSIWLPIIPSANERQAIINALQAHHLVLIEANDLIQVSPKAHEYKNWRGPLPPLKNASSGRAGAARR